MFNRLHFASIICNIYFKMHLKFEENRFRIGFYYVPKLQRWFKCANLSTIKSSSSKSTSSHVRKRKYQNRFFITVKNYLCSKKVTLLEVFLDYQLTSKEFSFPMKPSKVLLRASMYGLITKTRSKRARNSKNTSPRAILNSTQTEPSASPERSKVSYRWPGVQSFIAYTMTKVRGFACDSWIIKYSSDQPIRNVFKTSQKTEFFTVISVYVEEKRIGKRPALFWSIVRTTK